MGTRIAPKADTFHAVSIIDVLLEATLGFSNKDFEEKDCYLEAAGYWPSDPNISQIF